MSNANFSNWHDRQFFSSLDDLEYEPKFQREMDEDDLMEYERGE